VAHGTSVYIRVPRASVSVVSGQERSAVEEMIR